jgi:NADPH-dependent 2,4-dienoyl-CoA reductase/sulfur reductase-like enzyme
MPADAGTRIGVTGAIQIDEHLQTNVPAVFAAGDCAENTHLVTGRACWIPLGTTANKMGRAAGERWPRTRRSPLVAGTAIVRVCGLGVAITGLSAAQAKREGFQTVAVAIDARDRAAYFRGRPTSVQLIADRSSGRLLGGAVLGEYGVEGRINVIVTAIAARMTVDQVAGLDLAYAPPYAPLWDPILIAARQLVKEL